MRHRFLIISLIILSIVGCNSKSNTNNNTNNNTEEHLRERVELVQNIVLDNNPEKLWEMRDSKFRKENNKAEYIEFLKNNNKMAEFSNVIFTIEEVKLKGNRATVKINFSIMADKYSVPTTHIMYDYWVFEDGDWYIVHGYRKESSLDGW